MEKNVESAENFNKDYIFVSSDELIGNKKLQDLQGNNIKDANQGLKNNSCKTARYSREYFYVEKQSHRTILCRMR